MANKFYVVWKGREPGIYYTWEDALEQVEGFPGAKYKAYSTSAEAAIAFREGMKEEEVPLGQILMGHKDELSKEADRLLTLHDKLERFPEIDADAWAVDASCLGNPGVMEYQCIDLKTGRRVFHFGPISGATNNIGEFLAIVHALALMHKKGEWHTIYSDSRTALAWVRNKRVKTTLTIDKGNPKVIEMLARAQAWLIKFPYPVKILKWQTEIWGEIPADFGRK